MGDHEVLLALTTKMLECLARFADGKARPNEHAAGTISALRKAGFVQMIPRGTLLLEDDNVRHPDGWFHPVVHPRRYRITEAGLRALGEA